MTPEFKKAVLDELSALHAIRIGEKHGLGGREAEYQGGLLNVLGN